MNTTTKNHPATVSLETGNTKSAADFWGKAEFYRFGIIPMLLAVISILGGVAGAAGIEESPWRLLSVSVPTVITLSTILSVMPMRVITIACSTAVIIDLLVLFF